MNRFGQVVDVDLGCHYGTVTLNIPSRQSGMSMLVGFFAQSGRRYVAKFLRTDSIGVTFLGRSVALPLRKPLGRLPLKNNIFAPSPVLLRKVRADVEACASGLRSIDAEAARLALTQALGFPPGDAAAVIGAAMPAGCGVISFFPDVCEVVEGVLPLEREGAVTLVVVQNDLSTQDDRPVTAYSISFRPDKAPGKMLDARFLILLALAQQLAGENDVGLDLFPRLALARSTALVFQNVIAGSERADLTYIDAIGLFCRSGNFIQRTGYHMLFGRLGGVRLLARRICASRRWG